MRELSREQLKIWYFNAVRSVLILEKGLLPDEADAVLETANLRENLELYTEAQMHDDPRDVAEDLKCFFPAIGLE